MRKKAIILIAILCLSVFIQGCGTVEKLENSVYEKTFLELEEVKTQFSMQTKLSGLSENVCIMTGKENFDDEFLGSQCAGIFSEDESEILYLKNGNQKFYPASMTKCMTALLTLENCPDLEAEFTVPEEVFQDLGSDSSLAGLKLGRTYTISDLLYGLFVPSGNDAANALAFYIGGSIANFVQMMNERAVDLGMLNTHFANPHGLHNKNHYTTVYDFYLLLRTCIKNSRFNEYATTRSATITEKYEGEKQYLSLLSGNSFLRNFISLPDGISIVATKTGYTPTAGRCLSMVTQDNFGKTYIAVISHAPSFEGLYEEMNLLQELILKKNEE